MEKGRPEPDLIKLTLPCEERFFGVARIVVGGLAARLDLSYELLDDLQLAVEAVLAERDCLTGDTVGVELTVGERSIEVAIGPLDLAVLRTIPDGRSERIGLGTLLDTVVDAFAFELRADGSWLRFQKQAVLEERP